jgi:autotransporter-associated beta strand protein
MALKPIKIQDAMNNPKTLTHPQEVNAPMQREKQKNSERGLCFFRAGLFLDLAVPVWRAGKCIGLLAVMLGTIPHQLTAQNMGDTLTWNGSSTAGSSWATSTAGSWYDKTTSGGVILNSSGNRDKTYNFLFEGASGTSKVSPASMVVGGGNNFYANSITFEQGFNSTNTTSITNGAAGATSITFGAGNGSTSLSANATAWTLANNATTGNVTFTNGTGALTLKLFTSGNISVLNAGAITAIGSNITDFDATNKGGITKTGAGTLTLNGTNTYTGSTIVSSGTLSISSVANGGSNSNLGASSNASSNLVLGGGTLSYTGTSGSTDRNFTLANGTTSTISVGMFTALTFGGGAAAGNGSFTKAGGGELALTGASSHSGTTMVSAGTLSLRNANALQNSTLNTGSSGSSAVVVFIAAGSSDYKLGGLAGSNNLNIGANSISIGSNNADTTYSAVISSSGGGVTKTGSGMLTLNGTNTYTGATTVSGGTLALGSAGSIASGSVLGIASGATFDVKAKSGGFILNNTLTIDVGAANAGKLDATGVVLTYGNALTLNITSSTPLSSYDLFDFVNETGAFSSITLSGSFSGSMTDDSGIWTATRNGYDFTFNEANGVLSTAAVPEPGTWALLGIAAVFFLHRLSRNRSISPR